MSFLEFTEGPLWYVALAVFTLGVAWNIIGILAMRVRGDSAVPRKSPVAGGIKAERDDLKTEAETATGEMHEMVKQAAKELNLGRLQKILTL